MQTTGFSIDAIASHIGATIFNPHEQDVTRTITQLAPLKTAKNGELTFLTNPRWTPYAARSSASAIIVKDSLPHEASIVQLLHPNPQLGMALAAQLFYTPQHSFTGHSPLAVIDASATVASDAIVYPFAYIGPRSVLGPGCVVYPHTYIGEDCAIGPRTVIYPGATLMPATQVGADVIIHAGAVLGADGFGFAPAADKLHKIPQIGRVVIEDDVEIGPLVTIDRATFDETRVRRGAKLDSQVHIGHNVDVGEMSMLCGQVGVAGSAKIGKRCIAAGQSGISQGLQVADGVILGAKSALLQSQTQAGEYLGIPAVPAPQWRRQAMALKKLPDLLKQMQKLERRVQELESQNSGKQ